MHPTHLRTTRLIVLSLALLGLLLVGLGLRWAEWVNGENEPYLPVFIPGMSLLFAAIAAFGMRAFLCRCPGCSVWLYKQPQPVDDRLTRKFICENCQIIWDTQICLMTGGSD